MRLLVIDDDPVFGKLICKHGEQRGLNIDHFESLDQMGFFVKMKDYDIILIDFKLERLNGMEVAAYIPSFFSNKKVYLISSSSLEDTLQKPLPSHISAFIHKDKGVDEILNRAVA